MSEARKLLPQGDPPAAGVGAQGATPADVARAFTSGPASALVTVSRSVIYAFRFEGDDWRSAAGRRGCPAARRGLGRLGLVDRADGGAVGAPLAFLAAVTVAVLLVRAGLDEGVEDRSLDAAVRHASGADEQPVSPAASTASARATRLP